MRAIIFDLDGTIAYTHPLHFEAYFKLFSRLGIKWNYDEFNSLFAGTGPRTIIEKVLRENGIKDFDLEELSREKKEIFSEIMKNKKLTPVRGFHEFIQRAHEKGIPCAVASGSHYDSIIAMLKNLQILEKFGAVLSAHDVARPKPFPDVFLLSAEKLGVPPKQCLVLEDTAIGITAAKSAGMHCIALTTTTDDPKKLAEAGADEIIEDYNDAILHKYI